MQNKTKATATLAACATLAAGTLPLAGNGFIAATIGGLADWFAVTALFHKPFAVTALFHKPLGISYRTEILKRNRKRISEALIEFVSEDLLNTQNIMAIVKDENTARLLIEFLEDYRGRQKVKELVNEIAGELISEIDIEKISREIAPAVEDEIKKFDVTKIISAAVDAVTSDKNSRKILIMLFETGQKILKSKHMQDEIYKKIVQLRTAYEGDNMGRALVLSTMNLTDEKILSILNENIEKKISSTVAALKAENYISPEDKINAQELMNNFARAVKFATEDIDASKIQAEFENIFKSKVDIASQLKNWLEIDNKFLQREIDNFVDKKINEFIQDESLQNKFDALIKNMLENLIEENHEQIPALIRERLDKLDDDKLTEFVESRVSDDLQMIRINGSVCGALAGMFLYIVSQIIAVIVG